MLDHMIGSLFIFSIYFYFFDVDHCQRLYGICYNIAPVSRFGLFGREACGILALRPGIQPTPPALEGEVLTSDGQGSPRLSFKTQFQHLIRFLENLWGSSLLMRKSQPHGMASTVRCIPASRHHTDLSSQPHWPKTPTSRGFS